MSRQRNFEFGWKFNLGKGVSILIALHRFSPFLCYNSPFHNCYFTFAYCSLLSTEPLLSYDIPLLTFASSLLPFAIPLLPFATPLLSFATPYCHLPFPRQCLPFALLSIIAHFHFCQFSVKPYFTNIHSSIFHSDNRAILAFVIRHWLFYSLAHVLPFGKLLFIDF